MTRAAIYCRISQDRNETALGVIRQEKACRVLAESKGWTVAEVFVDNDVSAISKKPRPGYLAMVAAIEAGEIDGVVVWNLDRLTRKPREIEDVIDMADRYKVALATVGGEIDLATDQGRMMARMKGTVARYEADAMSTRIKAKKAEQAAQGRPSGGMRRYGYEKDGVTIREFEARVVREVAARLLNGASLRGVCMNLTQRGDLSSTGKAWQTSSMKALLTSPHVAGLRAHHGEVVEGTWPGVLDRETWEDLRDALTAAQRRCNTSNIARKHHWSGLIVCGLCTAMMRAHASGTKGRPLWKCRGCGRVSARKAEVDSLLDRALLAHIETARVEAAEATGPEAALEAEITRLERKQQGLLAAFEKDDAEESGVTYRQAAEPLAKSLDQARSAWRAAVRKSGTVLRLDPATVRERWDSMEPKERRDLAGAYVRSVVIGPTPVKGRHTFDPGRLRVNWLAV